jgi:hypothetical protein
MQPHDTMSETQRGAVASEDAYSCLSQSPASHPIVASYRRPITSPTRFEASLKRVGLHELIEPTLSILLTLRAAAGDLSSRQDTITRACPNRSQSRFSSAPIRQMNEHHETGSE